VSELYSLLHAVSKVVAVHAQFFLAVLCIYCILVICQFSADEEQSIRDPILAKYEKEGHPYYSSARYCTVS